MERFLISSERLRFRPFTNADTDELHRIFIEPGVRRFLWDYQIVSRERVSELIETSTASFASAGHGLWAVVSRQHDVIIGFCGFWTFHEPPRMELLYGVAPAFWKRGLATEAARAMIHYGFNQLSFTRIEASTDTANLASIAVMKKAGMKFWKRENTNSLNTTYYSISAEGANAA